MSYTRPDANAVAFTPAGYTAPAGGSVTATFPATAYTAPAGNSITAQFGAEYTRPLASAVNFSLPLGGDATGAGAVTTDAPDATGQAWHGVAGSGSITADHQADGAGQFTDLTTNGVGSVTTDTADADGLGSHGVSGTGTITTDAPDADGAGAQGVVAVGDITVQTPDADGSSGHGVSGFEEATVGIAASGQAAAGVAGTGTVTLPDHAAAGAGNVVRYELRGEVRDQSVLVNRRVRAYDRATGALVAEQDTVAGLFALTVGFESGEFYVVPIDLDPQATDWTPPVANRVVAILVQD